MSKAFVREDDVSEDSTPLPVYPVVPSGVPNYLTASGARRLGNELGELQEKRSVLAAQTGDPETRRAVQALDHRIRHLQNSLRTAEVVASSTEETDVVRFGATVTVRDNHGVETRYRLVGVDETDLDRGAVSWLSPIARALLKARKGDRVQVNTPRGRSELEILDVASEIR